MSERTGLRKRRAVTILAIAAFASVILAGAVGEVQASDCSGSVDGTLRRTEPADYYTNYSFALRASSPEQCAFVMYDMVIVEQDQNGETINRRYGRRTRVASGEDSLRKERYRLKQGHTMVEWSFEYTGCQLCDAP